MRYGVVLIGAVCRSGPARRLRRLRRELGHHVRRLRAARLRGRSVTFGGLPGYQYRVPLQAPKGGISRLFVLFDGHVEYFFNCQSTPGSRVALNGACDQALSTLERI